MVALSRIALNQTVERQSQLSRTIADLEAAIATGKKFVRPSDAPDQWTKLSEVSRQRADIAAARDPIASGTARAREADRWLGGLTDSFARAQELVVSAGGTPGIGRAAMAAELRGMRDDLPARFAQLTGAGTPLLDTDQPLLIGLGDGRTTATVPQASQIDLVPDTGTLADILDLAINAVESGNSVDIATALTALDASIAHLATEQARQGIRMQRLEEAETALISTDTDLLEEQSRLGDTDIAAAITMIQTLAVQRDAARAMLSRTAGTTLFDYLR
jgi:flagellin-like hook-associated protein FlgL